MERTLDVFGHLPVLYLLLDNYEMGMKATSSLKSILDKRNILSYPVKLPIEYRNITHFRKNVHELNHILNEIISSPENLKYARPLPRKKVSENQSAAMPEIEVKQNYLLYTKKIKSKIGSERTVTVTNWKKPLKGNLKFKYRYK